MIARCGRAVEGRVSDYRLPSNWREGENVGPFELLVGSVIPSVTALKDSRPFYLSASPPIANVSNLGHTGDVKPIIFHPTALEFIRGEDPTIRREIGEALRDLQKGFPLGMPLSRPMPDVASGAHELRVTGKNSAVRVFYFVKLADAILVFHAFQKKTQKTPKREMALGQQRLKEVLHGNV